MEDSEDYPMTFHEVCGHGRIECDECFLDSLEDGEDADDWECAYPGECLMPSPHHQRSECHTVADAEAYYADELAAVGKE